MTNANLNELSDDALDDVLDRGDDEVKGGAYRAEPFWYLKNEGDVSILRFMEESPDWRKVKTHRFFPTGPEPEGYEGKWPSAMPGTCRADDKLKRFFPGGCPIDSSGYEGKFKKGSRPDDVRYTLAVEREEYTNEAGRKAYRDKEIEVPVFGDDGKEVEGETITLPSLVIVAETMWRMMSAVKANNEAFGTIRGQDLRLKLIKNPNGNGLVVQVVPLNPDPKIQPGTEHWEMYTHAQKLWAPGGLNVNRVILSRAKDEYWNKFFLAEDGRTHEEHRIKRGGSPEGAASTGGGSTASSAPAEEAPNADKLAAMRARIAAQSV
jgi:hypothetical protein